jgi:hypothetical protein
MASKSPPQLGQCLRVEVEGTPGQPGQTQRHRPELRTPRLALLVLTSFLIGRIWLKHD